MMVVLDALQLMQRERAHAYLRGKLELPEYYGNNLDALFDVLTELPETEVCFRNVEEAERELSYFRGVRRVFEDAAAENDGLRVIF